MRIFGETPGVILREIQGRITIEIMLEKSLEKSLKIPGEISEIIFG